MSSNPLFQKSFNVDRQLLRDNSLTMRVKIHSHLTTKFTFSIIYNSFATFCGSCSKRVFR